jgi:hypothetical protein
MHTGNIHLIKNRLERNSNLFLLFIPIVVFVLVLSIFIAITKKAQIASFAEPSVLGDETAPSENQTIFDGKY